MTLAHSRDGDPPTHEAGGVLTIDLDALAANWRLLARRAPGAECAAVVKANAYGIGIEPAVPALAAAGCRDLLRGASRARPSASARVAPDATIYVLNGLLPGIGAAYSEHRPAAGPRLARGDRRMGGASAARNRDAAQPRSMSTRA